MAKNKKAFPTDSAPRSLDDLMKVYGEMVNQLGQLTYQISVYQTEVTRLTAEIVAVNQEAARRKELDSKKEAVAQETPNVE